MNIKKKKNLVARTLKIGKGRIVFDKNRLNEIKEIITKQDVRDLLKNGVIKIKTIKGRRKKVNKRKKRGFGRIKKKVNKRKKVYVFRIRKLRKYINHLLKTKVITKEKYYKLRKMAKAGAFKSRRHLIEYIQS